MAEKLSTRWRFFIVPHSIFDVDLSSRAKLVYCCLAHYANRDLESFPSVHTIAAACGVSDNTCRSGLRELQAAGLLCRENRHDENGARQTDLYTLDAPPDPTEGGGGSNSEPGGFKKRYRGGSKSEPELDPHELDPVNNNHIDTVAPRATGGDDAPTVAVVVMNRYREITGLTDLRLPLIDRWLQQYGLAKIQEKLELMQRTWDRVRIPASWLGQALRYDWCSAEDVADRRASTKRQAMLEKTQQIIAQSRAAAERAIPPEERSTMFRRAISDLVNKAVDYDA